MRRAAVAEKWKYWPGVPALTARLLVDGQPVRERASAQWCMAALEQCWSEKQRTYAPAEMEQAKADYEHARVTYRRILDESSR